MSEAIAPPQETWRETLARFTEPKMAMMLVLGFTAGLPFLLYFSTLGVWLERSETSVALIGFFSWFGLSYSLKMFWAPILDKVKPAGFTAIFGLRRAWILVALLSWFVWLLARSPWGRVLKAIRDDEDAAPFAPSGERGIGSVNVF